MDVIKAIKKRRSIRSYKNKKPDWRDIIEAIHSCQYAPMAGNLFSLKFVLVDDKEKIEKISKWAEQSFIAQAKYVVVVISDPDKLKYWKERAERYMHQQAGAAIQNFLLHLTKVGLSTCWIGHFNDEEIKRILKIPASKVIEALFPIGYAKEKIKDKNPKGEIYKILRFNDWETKRMKRKEVIEGRGPEGY